MKTLSSLINLANILKDEEKRKKWIAGIGVGVVIILSPFLIIVALFSPLELGEVDPYPLAIQSFKQKYEIDRVTFSSDDVKAIEMTILDTDLELTTKNEIEGRLEGYTYVSTIIKEETITTLNDNAEFSCEDLVYPDISDIPEEQRPVIEVQELISIKLGQEVNFLDYVSSTDYQGAVIQNVACDNSNVDFNNVGQYPLLITAKDGEGHLNYMTTTVSIEPGIKQIEIKILNLKQGEELHSYLRASYNLTDIQLEDVDFFIEMRKYFGTGNGEMMLSPKVLEYKELVEKYCKENGIGDFVDYVLCIIQQESGGQGIDIMQCAESGQGEINTAEDSIKYGIAYFKKCLDAAGVESVVDQQRVKLALQGYNFGSGYISWALENTNGYSLESAYSYSEMKKFEMNWQVYGDPEYVPHVLRYYGTSITVEGDLKTVIDMACQQIGKPYVWGAIGPDSFDCSGLMQWAYAQAGISIGRTTWDQVENGTPVGLGELQPGDLIFFHTMDGNPPTHVGLYLSGGTFIHAASEETGVIYSDLNTPYWQGVYYASRRIANGNATE